MKFGKLKKRLSESSKLSKDPKFGVVMHEFGQGGLKSSSGKKVEDQKQALAIAFSEARRHRAGKKR